MSLPSPVPMRKDKKIIPRDELMFWVENNVNTDGVNIIKIRDAHLWTQGDYERHRLDVFEKYEVEGEGEYMVVQHGVAQGEHEQAEDIRVELERCHR